jgi:carbon-monoxide dehydrogenase medium subunit
LNLRLARPKVLVDLNGVSGLDGITDAAQGLTIGALARQSRVAASVLVREKCPILAEAIRHIGHAAIRHRGTIGGSLVHADPAAELPAVALALEAKFIVAREGATHTIAAADFFLDSLTAALQPDEILTEIVFPVLQPSTGYAFEEIVRRHGDFAIAGVAALVDLDRSGSIADARIALFGVAPTPVRARAVEKAVIGRPAGGELFGDAAALLDPFLEPHGDIRASSAYRKHAARVLTATALARAAEFCRSRRS